MPSQLPVSLTRDQLYELVWQRPVRAVARDIGVSDVAVHKACRRHSIPTPPPGYWAKLQFGKPVTRTPLGKLKASEARLETITIHRQWQRNLPDSAVAELNIPPDPSEVLTPESAEFRLIEATFKKLERLRPSRDGLVECDGSKLIHVKCRPESLSRTRILLENLLAAAKLNGISISAQTAAAQFVVGDESVRFAVEEVADKVPHTPTAAELKAVAKWEANRDATLKRGGYWWDRNPPPIPKWCYPYQGRLAVRLEEIRAQSDESYGGTALRSTYGDMGAKKVEARVPTILAGVFRGLEAKRNNKLIEARRKAAAEELARQRAAQARRADLKMKRDQALIAFEKTQHELVRLNELVGALEACSIDGSSLRLARMIAWVKRERDQKLRQLTPQSLDDWLAKQGCFETDDPYD